MKTSNKGAPRSRTDKQSAEQVSELTTNRLSVYLRCLNTLEDAGVRVATNPTAAGELMAEVVAAL